ncbi:hypothetical protein HZ326_17019 [Fusarium oxysporum f. sp. albedinis]|nr:hypothetical protein HZ326_17019 [Fusarium oxysporum f. sp. albedinis]
MQLLLAHRYAKPRISQCGNELLKFHSIMILPSLTLLITNCWVRGGGSGIQPVSPPEVVEMGRSMFLNLFKRCSRRATVYVQAPPPWNVPPCSTPCHRLGRLTFVISNTPTRARLYDKAPTAAHICAILDERCMRFSYFPASVH